jgi:hypothetical protein
MIIDSSQKKGASVTVKFLFNFDQNFIWKKM